jgi:hypothetical protein
VLFPHNPQKLLLCNRSVFMKCVEQHPQERRFDFRIQCAMPPERTWLLRTV